MELPLAWVPSDFWQRQYWSCRDRTPCASSIRRSTTCLYGDLFDHCAASLPVVHGPLQHGCIFDNVFQTYSVPVTSIQFSPHFIPPFLALHNALVMQLECSVNGTSTISRKAPVKPAVRRAPRHSVTFSSQVDIALGEDENWIPVYSQTTIAALSLWSSKPWSLHGRGPRLHHLHDSGPLHSNEGFVPTYERTDPPALHEPNPWDRQPAHIQDLGVAMQEFANIDDDGNPFFDILTWYVHGREQREGRHSRLIRLNSNFLTWTHTIKRAWRDLIRPQLPVEFYVIHPEPPIAEGETHIAQLLIVQAPLPFERAVLMSAVYYAERTVAIQRLALFAPHQLYRQQCIDLAEIPQSVRHRSIRAFFGWRPILDLPHPPCDIPEAAAITVQVRPSPPALAPVEPRSRSRTPRRDLFDSDDEVVLLAHQGHVGPAEGRIIDHPDIAHDPQQIEEPPVEAEDDTSDTASTYDSTEQSLFFHIFQLRAPMQAARIRTDSWPLMHGNIRTHLRLGRHQIQQIHVMNYRPGELRAMATQVALVQQRDDIAPGSTVQMILVDIVFHGHERADVRMQRFAQLVEQQITRAQLLEHLGVAPYCNLPPVRKRCMLRHNGRQMKFQDLRLHTMTHGDYLRVDLPPIPRSTTPTRFIARCLRDGISYADIDHLFHHGPDTDYDWDTVTIEDPISCDELNLMQRTAAAVRPTPGAVAQAQGPALPARHLISLEDCIPASPRVHVDFSTVLWSSLALSQVWLDPARDFPPNLEIPEVSQQAMQQLIAHHSALPIAFHFYVDGSKMPGCSVGAAVLLLCEYPDGLAFGGYLCRRVNDAESAHLGEHSAMIWALLWALRCSDQIQQYHAPSEVVFFMHFDATGTGYQAAGWWRTFGYSQWKTFMRALAHILVGRHGQHALRWRHVKAHNDHPWNELVDRLAKHASRMSLSVLDCEPWYSWLHNESMLVAIQWIWFYERLQHGDPVLPQLCGQCLIHNVLAASPRTAPPSMPLQSTFDYESVDISLCFATANVLTLATLEERGNSALTRQRLLQEQFDHAGCHIVAVQETRHRKIVDQGNPWFHIIGHHANAQGQDGIQLWFSKRRPLCPHGTFINFKYLILVHASPNALIVKLQLPEWRCLVVTGRAPHSGHGMACSVAYWKEISKILHRFDDTWPILFMGDTNGHVGAIESPSIGTLAAKPENTAGAAFHDWLLEHRLFAPSTFQQFHSGEVHETFIGPDGIHTSRIDYVALPRDLQFQHLKTFVGMDIDMSLQRPDHLPLLCQLTFIHHKPVQQQRSGRRLRIDAQQLAQVLLDEATHDDLRQRISSPGWHVDPHTSADLLADQTQCAIRALVTAQPIWRRKQHISTTTWDLVNEKKMLFRQLRALSRTRKMTIMKAVFQGWRSTFSTSSVLGNGCDDYCLQLSAWFKLHDHACALNFFQYKRLAGAVVTAIRFEDAQYYADLAAETGLTYTKEGLTGIWKRLKAVLPKHRDKRHQLQHEMGDALRHHFESLEAGFTTSSDKLLESCLASNCKAIECHPSDSFFALHELPTLAEIEELCLRQRPRKAAGPDGLPSDVCRLGAVAIAPALHNVILKSFLNGTEPLRYKGGKLCTIWKRKGSRFDPESYRGILLADTYGKIFHAWSRSRLLPTLQLRRAQGQLGGLPSQQTSTGIQAIRLHCRLGRLRHYSTGTLFVDLRAAFHHMIREWIFSVDNDQIQTTLLKFLDPRDFDVGTIARELEHLCQHQPHDIPDGLPHGPFQLNLLISWF